MNGFQKQTSYSWVFFFFHRSFLTEYIPTETAASVVSDITFWLTDRVTEPDHVLGLVG